MSDPSRKPGDTPGEPPRQEGPPGGTRQFRSDPPVEDLKRERDVFIQQFFRRGAQISEELLGEVEKLRSEVRALEMENARLRTYVASERAIGDLLRKIQELESEKAELIKSTDKVPSNTNEIAERFAEVEAEHADLGTLHIAMVQLHNATTVRRAVRNLRELLAQFLGAAHFAVYLATEDRTALVAIAIEGISAKDARYVSAEDTKVFSAFERNQVHYMTDGDITQGTVENPAAIIPILLGGLTIGVIAIFRTLPQKTSFGGVDQQLFKLLSSQAALPLVFARFFNDAGRRAPSVQAFIDPED